MDTKSVVRAGAIVGIVAVFGALFSWQSTVLEPVVAENLVLFQLVLATTVIALFRTEIGVSSFGVFAPVIIAFAWISAGALWGFILVSYLFLLAVVTRLTVSEFELSTPHRVAVILTTVVFGFLILTAVSITQTALPEFGTALLFPAIVTAWYGERFVNMVEDDGWTAASNRLAWTVVLIWVAYLVVSFDPLVEWFAATPLAWAGIVGLHIFLGDTTTFRLSEYVRFGALSRSLAGGGSTANILSMRVRNREFVGRYNPGYLLANFGKLTQKRLYHGLDLPTPETYLLLDEEGDLDDLDALLEEQDQFALKPDSGSGGTGILVVTGRTDGGYETSRGILSADDIRDHAAGLLSGRYEQGYATSGRGYVEELVHPRGELSDICGDGVPDLRIIVLRGIPIMAMARLPTRASHGAANLHAGAVGVGVDLATGTSGDGYQQTTNQWLDEHPDTGEPFDFEIPAWQSVLELASKAATASQLGYAGVDIVFDADQGPLILEVNRRPGLGIQNVNLDGLLRRLRVAEGNVEDLSLRSASARVAAARAWSRANWEVTDES